MRILIDLDGPAYPFYEDSIEAVQALDPAAWDTSVSPSEYGYYRLWRDSDGNAMSSEVFVGLMREASRTGQLYRRFGPREGFRDALAALRADGHEIVIVTARSYHETMDEASTRWWLDAHDIPYDELHFAKDKTKFNCDYAIEDYTENAQRLTDAGATSFIFDFPWNQDYKGPRVASWAEFVAAVRERVAAHG